jgi:hypothetical protein
MSENSCACACACGNIRVKGHQLPSGSYPNIPASERPRLAACRSLISVRSGAIVVRDLQQTAVKPRSAVCYDLHCHNCSQIFRLFAGRGIAILSRLPESAPVPATAVRFSGRGIPPAVAPLIAAPEAPCPQLEDPEFEVMFSGEADPIVGSYRPQACLPGERLPGSEEMPRSYYT